MEQQDLWQAFAQTGRVEDYLRYRGVSLTGEKEGDTVGGKQQKTASDDRRSHPTGI